MEPESPLSDSAASDVSETSLDLNDAAELLLAMADEQWSVSDRADSCASEELDDLDEGVTSWAETHASYVEENPYATIPCPEDCIEMHQLVINMALRSELTFTGIPDLCREATAWGWNDTTSWPYLLYCFAAAAASPELTAVSDNGVTSPTLAEALEPSACGDDDDVREPDRQGTPHGFAALSGSKTLRSNVVTPSVPEFLPTGGRPAQFRQNCVDLRPRPGDVRAPAAPPCTYVTSPVQSVPSFPFGSEAPTTVPAELGDVAGTPDSFESLFARMDMLKFTVADSDEIARGITAAVDKCASTHLADMRGDMQATCMAHLAPVAGKAEVSSVHMTPIDEGKYESDEDSEVKVPDAAAA